MKVFRTILLVFLSYSLHKTLGYDGDNVGSDSERTKLLSRARRTLVYHGASQLLLIFGLGTPLQLDRESVIVGAFTKLLYTLPANSTDLTEPGVFFERTQKSRWSIYKVLERIGSLYGFGGKACLLRAICEVTFTPFDHHHGLLGQLVQTLLTIGVVKYRHYGGV
ncbi:uncharacterized protein [Chelonus insularis]|uniref:uncharacterized protein isoform X2 n=1 Tax=Chelonus insularis TaxID=460826 RepID=UPI00158AD09D|nr:uncharacterized protein LOC118064544 isoform X2 [Chelonus insularis]